MAYNRKQRRNIGIALQMTRRDPTRIRRALLEAMSVEASFHHLSYGDRDSQGVLQQRPSQGWGPFIPGARGVRTDISQFLSRARRNNKGFRGTAGQLAQSVQRSAFPGRYDDRRKEANRLMNNYKKFAGMSPAHSSFQAKGFGGGGGVSKKALLQFVMANNASFASGQFDPVSTGQTLVAALRAYKQGGDLGARKPTAPNAMNPRPRSRAAAMIAVMRKAKNMGLSVRENPMYDHVDPVHTEGSDHYKRFRKGLGRAADISGDPRKEKKFARWAVRRYGSVMKDLFHDPLGWSYDEGRRIGRNLAPGHQHVHISF